MKDPAANQAKRDAAAENLTNIDADERARRAQLGAAAGVFSVGLAAVQLTTGAPPAQRAFMVRLWALAG